jgi:hypothetical protein
MLSEFNTHIPSADSTLAQWASFASEHRSVYGDIKDDTHIWKTTTMNCKAYDASKKAVFNTFIHSLANHATLHPLVEIVPGEDGELTYLFIILIRGVKCAKKRALCNALLICWARGFYLKGEYEHQNLLAQNDLELKTSMMQPNTIARMHRQIFKIFLDNSVLYRMGEFKYAGGFQAIWKTLFDRTQIVRPGYGSKPNQAVIDLDDFDKIAECDEPYMPFKKYTDMMQLLPYMLTETLTLRAGNEVSF